MTALAVGRPALCCNSCRDFRMLGAGAVLNHTRDDKSEAKECRLGLQSVWLGLEGQKFWGR